MRQRNSRITPAARLASGLSQIAGVVLAYPVDANEVFVRMPDDLAAYLRERGFSFHDWASAGDGGRRLVTSPMTTEAEADAFLAAAVQFGTRGADQAS